MNTLRLGLVGCGDIAHIRAQAIAQSSSCELVTVADLDTARARAFAAKYKAAADESWAAMIERPDVDAIVISTPPSSHAEIGMAAMRAGKHVICEKPLARTTEECQAMVDAAASTGRVLATGFNYRFYPSVLKAREFFEAGAIGELDHMRAYTGYSATAHNHPWLHDADVMGGGTLRDNGIHLIDTALYFFGDPVDVQGYGTNDVWKFPGCEDNGFVIARNAQDKVLTLQSSWTEWAGYKFSIEIYGSKGCIRIRCFPMITQVVTGGLGAKTQSKQSFYFPKVHFMEHLKSYRWIVLESFVVEFDEFRLAIEGKKSRVASGHDGLRSVDLAYRACLNMAPAAVSRAGR